MIFVCSLLHAVVCVVAVSSSNRALISMLALLAPLFAIFI